MTAQADNQSVETLPAHWYHDEDIYQRERQLIFARHWTLVGPDQSIAQCGDYLASDVAGWPVAVVRQADGTLKAFHNVCRHRAARLLTQPAGRCETLRCPYHGWTYRSDGSLSAAPGFDTQELRHNGDGDLWPVDVASWNGLVFARIQADGPDIESWLAEIPAAAAGFPAVGDMQFHCTRQNTAAVNWKTYSDNSAEGYHLGLVHGELFASLSNNRTEIRAWPDSQCVGFEVEYRAQGGQQRPRGLWIYKFPGLLLHFSDYGFNAERVSPDGPRSANLTRWFWFPADTPDAAREESVALSSKVMDQDLEICRSVQVNLEAGRYRTGRVSAAREPGTVLFQALVRQALSETVESR